MDRIDVQPLSAASGERLDRLFRLYSSRVLAYAVTQAKRTEDAHDIAGETWVRVVADIHRLRADDDHAFGWLRTIATRAAVDHYRPKRATEQPRDWTDAVASFPLPAVQAADVETDVFALADLSVSQCTAVKLAAQGLTHRAIASRMNRSAGAVYSHLHRGARKLRTVMADQAPKPPLPKREPGATNPPKPRAAAYSRASVALAG
ncbi:RNA polymerase sigma factor [Streptomyces sp. NPDC002324]